VNNRAVLTRGRFHFFKKPYVTQTEQHEEYPFVMYCAAYAKWFLVVDLRLSRKLQSVRQTSTFFD
jgi:hypothetical protein